MNKKTKRLHEEELVNEMAPVAPAQPAAPAEVEAAQPVVEPVAEELPQPTVDEPIISTPQEPATPADPLTPPAPGMIPSGWIRPEDLAAAIAQQTGDAEVASTAEDATITEEPVPVEPEADSATAVEAPATAAPVVEEEIILESISREELDVIREYRLYKALKEAEDLPGDDLSGPSPYNAAEGDMSSRADKPVSLNLQESEEDAEDEVNDTEEEIVEDVVAGDDVIDMFDEEDVPEGIDYEDMEDDDIIASVNDFLANFDDFEASSEIPEVLRTVADFIEDVVEEAPEAEDLPSEDEIEDIEAALDEENFEEVDEDIELEDEAIDFEDDEEDFEESRHFVRRVECKVSRKDRLTEEVIYPAGSSPSSSNWPSADSNLIRSYEESQARRREALRTYRENSINKPSENFTKALNSSVRLSEKTSVDSKSWSANKFLDKYKESREFSFNDLLRDGFLG